MLSVCILSGREGQADNILTSHSMEMNQCCGNLLHTGFYVGSSTVYYSLLRLSLVVGEKYKKAKITVYKKERKVSHKDSIAPPQV